MHIRARELMLAGLAVAGCSSGSEPPGALRLEAVQPPPAQSLPGQVFDEVKVRVSVDDRGGRSITVIRFAGDGTVDPAEAVTGKDGVATVRWALPRTPVNEEFDYMGGPPGEFHLTASIDDTELMMHTSAHALTLDKVDAASTYACGTAAGRLLCWGYRLDWVAQVPGGWHPGDLVEYPDAGQVVELAAIMDAVCVLGPSGLPLCTGFKSERQWVGVSGAPPLAALTGGGSTFCGLAADHTAWCWSDAFVPAFVATQVSSTLQFAQLEAGGGSYGASDTYACGLTLDGVAWCWNIRNDHGQVGNGTTEPSPAPSLVSGNHLFKQIELSYTGACGVELDESIWCWGSRGLLPAESHVPVQVTLPGVVGPILDVGWVEGYVRMLSGIHSWFVGDLFHLAQLDALDAVTISADNGTLCTLTQAKEAFCSWTLVYGGEETSLLPAQVVPVPRPGVPLPPLRFALAGTRGVAGLKPQPCHSLQRSFRPAGDQGLDPLPAGCVRVAH